MVQSNSEVFQKTKKANKAHSQDHWDNTKGKKLNKPSKHNDKRNWKGNDQHGNV